jgi:hypothetical protein
VLQGLIGRRLRPLLSEDRGRAREAEKKEKREQRSPGHATSPLAKGRAGRMYAHGGGDSSGCRRTFAGGGERNETVFERKRAGRRIRPALLCRSYVSVVVRSSYGQEAPLFRLAFPHCPEAEPPLRSPAVDGPQVASVPAPSTPVTRNQRSPAGTPTSWRARGAQAADAPQRRVAGRLARSRRGARSSWRAGRRVPGHAIVVGSTRDAPRRWPAWPRPRRRADRVVAGGGTVAVTFTLSTCHHHSNRPGSSGTGSARSPPPPPGP